MTDNYVGRNVPRIMITNNTFHTTRIFYDLRSQMFRTRNRLPVSLWIVMMMIL